jgi:hypothetical protein
MRRVLSNLFMALSSLCFAVPALQSQPDFPWLSHLPDAASVRAKPLLPLPKRWPAIPLPAPEFSSR